MGLKSRFGVIFFVICSLKNMSFINIGLKCMLFSALIKSKKFPIKIRLYVPNPRCNKAFLYDVANFLFSILFFLLILNLFWIYISKFFSEMTAAYLKSTCRSKAATDSLRYPLNCHCMWYLRVKIKKVNFTKNLKRKNSIFESNIVK